MRVICATHIEKLTEMRVSGNIVSGLAHPCGEKTPRSSSSAPARLGGDFCFSEVRYGVL